MHKQKLKSKKYINILKNSSIFQDFEEEKLKKLLSKMTLNKWEIGRNLTNYQGVLPAFYFICSGRVKEFQIEDNTGREHTFFILKQGDIFDIMNLLDNEPHDMLWETLDEVEVLSIPKKMMLEWIEKYPIMHDDIYNYLGKRIRGLEESASTIAIHNTLVRLAKLILNHITGNPPKIKLINNLSNKEIASLIGTTRAVANRHLQELKKVGAIDLERKKIHLQDIHKLITIAEENQLK